MALTRTQVITDSACDLPAEWTDAAGIVVLPFPYVLDGVERLDDSGRTMSFDDFYAALDRGVEAHTAQVPYGEYHDAFAAAYAEGAAAVLIGLSSGLTGSLETALMARSDFLAEHPDAEIYCLDSLGASAGEGQLVLEAARLAASGMPAAELARWVEENRLRVNHIFTVASFEHLVKGGRVSPAVGMVGSMLDIKPVLRVDPAGHLVPLKRPRGRRRAIEIMADLVSDLIVDPAGQRVLVSYGNCPEDAEHLIELLKERAGVTDVAVTRVGVIIGTHTGGGVLSAYFWGKERD